MNEETNQSLYHSILSEEKLSLSSYRKKVIAAAMLPFPASYCLCFSGHRHLSAQEISLIQSSLPSILDIFYARGKRLFLSGGALGFDTLAACAVLSFKKVHPDVQLLLAIPCLSQSDRWTVQDRKQYIQLLDCADYLCFVSMEYYPGCMQKRNRFLVESADTCLCYMTHCRGGTWNTVSYAYDLHREILNLASC